MLLCHTLLLYHSGQLKYFFSSAKQLLNSFVGFLIVKNFVFTPLLYVWT